MGAMAGYREASSWIVHPKMSPLCICRLSLCGRDEFALRFGEGGRTQTARVSLATNSSRADTLLSRKLELPKL